MAGSDRPRRAGVSSFGISGTNAHVILEEPRRPPRRPPSGPGPAAARAGRRCPWLPFRPHAMPARARRPPGCDPGRRRAPTRPTSVLTGHHTRHVRPRGPSSSPATARGCCAASRAGHGGTARRSDRQPYAGPARLRVHVHRPGRPTPRYGQELYAREPVFAAALDEVCAPSTPHLADRPRVMWPGGKRRGGADELDRRVHPGRPLRRRGGALPAPGELGVRPDLLIGHSIGELAAAHVAGVFTLADACRLVAASGRLMQELPAGGAWSPSGRPRRTCGHCSGNGRGVSPPSTARVVVLSGDEDAVLSAARQLGEAGPQDIAPARQPRLPLAPHGPHARGVPQDRQETCR